MPHNRLLTVSHSTPPVCLPFLMSRNTVFTQQQYKMKFQPRHPSLNRRLSIISLLHIFHIKWIFNLLVQNKKTKKSASQTKKKVKGGNEGKPNL